MASMTESSLLRPETMLAAARERTGLADFGDPSFRDGFDRLVTEIDSLRLSPAAAGASAHQIGTFLEARLASVAGWNANPQSRQAPIERPLIIAGLVRSGTTALHQLLSLDPQFQVPEHWLTLAPMPRPARERWDEVPQYRSIRDHLAALVAAAPEMAADHMMTAEGAEESLFILAQTFASNMYPSMWHIPQYDRWFRSRDDTASYAWLADVLRLIGSGSGGGRWLLKNPTDLYSMNEVLNVFPDAMVVQTHRDPVAAIPSIASLILAASKIFMGDKADPTFVGRREAHFWKDALDRAEAARARAPDQFIDVEFGPFVRDQLGTIRRIYHHFGLALSAETEARMQAWLDANPRRADSGTRYTPESFGLTRDGLAQIYQSYRARRGYA